MFDIMLGARADLFKLLDFCSRDAIDSQCSCNLIQCSLLSCNLLDQEFSIVADFALYRGGSNTEPRPGLGLMLSAACIARGHHLR
jgi:hypothetical protein